MDTEYPDPNPTRPSNSLGGPYFVPGIELYGYDESELVDDRVAHGTYDAQPLSDPGDATEDSDGEDIGLDGLAASVEQELLQDAEFEPKTSGIIPHSDNESTDLTGTSGDENEVFDRPEPGRTSRARGRGSRSRGVGRRRGRLPKGRGDLTGRGGRESVESFDVLLDGRVKKRGRLVPRGEGRGAGRKGKRGPRIVKDAGREFNELQNKATRAFVAQRWEECEDICKQALQLNPEIFAAHSLLSQVYSEQGRTQDSLEVLFNGALTIREPSVWWEVVFRIQDVLPDDENERTQRLLQAYSNIVRLNKHDYHARLARIELFQETGNRNGVVKECKSILVSHPHDLKTLRLLAEESLNIGTPARARPAFENAIEYYMEVQSQEEEEGFTFRDLNLYAELLKQLKEYSNGLQEVKRLARWLLGRQEEWYWDDFQADDREWDDEDEPRRIEVTNFIRGRFRNDQYGQGLPPDVRVKMGLFRLHFGPDHLQEALVRRSCCTFPLKLTTQQCHFNAYDPAINLPLELVQEFEDLIRDIAEALYQRGHHADAMRFFKALETGHVHMDVATSRQAGKSACAIGDEDMAFVYFCKVIELQPRDSEIRLGLAAITRRRGDLDKVKEHIDQVVQIETPHTLHNIAVRQEDANTLMGYVSQRAGIDLGALDPPEQQDEGEGGNVNLGNEVMEDDLVTDQIPHDLIRRPSREQQLKKLLAKLMWRPRPSGRYTNYRPRDQEKQKRSLDVAERNVRELYSQLNSLQNRVNAGDERAKFDWTAIAQDLTSEFLSQKSFFPSVGAAKNIVFLGFRSSDRQAAATSAPRSKEFFEVFGEYIMQTEGDNSRPLMTNDWPKQLSGVPRHFGGISFHEWFEILLQYALNVCTLYDDPSCYDILSRLLDCLIFIHHQPSFRALKTAEVACCLHLNDNTKACELLRWFTSEDPLCADVYRLYGLVHRVHDGPVHAYSTGPQQKYFSRLVKARDYLAMNQEQRKRIRTHGVDIERIVEKHTKDREACTPLAHSYITSTSRTSLLKPPLPSHHHYHHHHHPSPN